MVDFKTFSEGENGSFFHSFWTKKSDVKCKGNFQIETTKIKMEISLTKRVYKRKKLEVSNAIKGISSEISTKHVKKQHGKQN